MFSRGLYWISTVVVMSAAIATLLGFLGMIAWPFALLDHLRPHYVLCIGAASLFLWFCRSEPLTQPCLWIGLVALSLNMSLLLPFIIPPNTSIPPLGEASSASETSLRILHFNLDRGNRQRDRVIDYLNQQDADLLLLQEITPDWLSLIEQDLTRYEMVTALPQSNSQGSAVLKRHNQEQGSANLAITTTQVHAFPADSTRPILSAEVTFNGQTMTILSLHVTRPRNASTANFQKTELTAIAQWVHTIQTPTHPVIILGDFNSTPWSQVFRTFQRQSGLLLSQQGWGLKSTWPAILPPFLQIPIDCCLHSSSLMTLNYQVGPNLGSDHRPIAVQLR